MTYCFKLNPNCNKQNNALHVFVYVHKGRIKIQFRAVGIEQESRSAYQDRERTNPLRAPLNVPPVCEISTSTALEIHLHAINSRLVGSPVAVVLERRQQIRLFAQYIAFPPRPSTHYTPLSFVI